MNRSKHGNMGKANGKTQVQNARIDSEHELPPAESDEDSQSPSQQTSAGTIADGTSELSMELQKVKSERDALLDRLARAQAEFENARRRSAKEQQEYRDFALTDAVKTLLPVMDSFERALQVKSDSNEFRNGIELIYKQLQDALAKLGVRPILAKGEPFDPQYHEAIEMVETSDAPDHHVIEELQRGYKLKDRLLRPAMVKVAKNPAK
jgi:molecular chaperone GrpE